MSHPDSFWRETLPAPPPRPLQTGLDVDVAIVGGGFTGLSTALSLRKAEPDLSVAVLEAQSTGYGASGRNAGFAMTLFGLTLEVTAWRFGRNNATEAFHHMRAAVAAVERVATDESIDCDLERTGLLVVSNSASQQARLASEVELARSLGIRSIELWDKDRLAQSVRSPLYHGAKHDPDCALLNPWKLVHGLRQAAERHGAQVYDEAPVRSLRRTPAHIELETAGGTVRAGKVVLATNAYSTWLSALDRRAAPVFTYIVTTEPLSPEQLASIGWEGRQGVEDGRNLVHYYRLTADNRLLLGGGDVRYCFGGRPNDPARATDVELRKQLSGFIPRVFPGLRGVRVTHHWGGPVSVPLDMAPAMGALGKDRRVFYSLGCVGHGVALTVLNGQILTDLVLGRETELSRRFFVDRRVVPFPREPIRFGLAHTIRGALALQDRWQERRMAKALPRR